MHARHHSSVAGGGGGKGRGASEPVEVEAGRYDGRGQDGRVEQEPNLAARKAEPAGDAAPALDGAVGDGAGGYGAVTDGAEDGGRPSSEDVLKRDEQGYSEGERKKGVLRKLHLHKV